MNDGHAHTDTIDGDTNDQVGDESPLQTPSTRRAMFQSLAAIGVGGVVFQRAVAAQVEETPTKPTADMIAQAEWVAGVSLTDE